MKIDFFNHLQLALELQIIIQIIADPFDSFTELWQIELSLSLIKSEDKILWCYYKIKTSLAELLHSTSTIIFYFYDFTEIIKLRKFLEFFTVPLASVFFF